MSPLVSILIPAFNAQKWIADTIKSAISQTWQRKEIIIVDDGSTDQTLQVARQFASKGVAVVSQDNQGASAARNVALGLSQGDYIQWLDADDLLASDKIALQMKMLELLQNDRILLSSACGRFIYRVGRAVFTPTRLWGDLDPVEWLVRKMGESLYMQTGTWLVSRKLTSAAGPWNSKLLVDNDGEYFCRVLLESCGIKFVPNARAYYRRTGDNCLSFIGYSDAKLESKALSMKLQVRYLRSLKDSVRVREACVRYLQNSLLYFFPLRPDLVAEFERIAIDLGGKIEAPSLSWKYEWLRRLFGWEVAKGAQLALPNAKWSAIRFLDRALYLIQNRNASAR